LQNYKLRIKKIQETVVLRASCFIVRGCCSSSITVRVHILPVGSDKLTMAGYTFAFITEISTSEK
jgi:hypothetical protein